MPDFGRFSKNRLAGYHQYFALPVIGKAILYLKVDEVFYLLMIHRHSWCSYANICNFCPFLHLG